MDKKEEIKKVLFLVLSVGLIVPIWGTFHGLIGIKTAWVAFVSAAVFFTAGHKLKDSPAIVAGHIMGLGWGIALITLLNRTEFQQYDKMLVSLVVLCVLGVSAVIVTHLNISLISHLPSLFCGWAVTLGVLGGIPPKNWSNLPFDLLLSFVAGVFIVGAGISQLHSLLIRLAGPKESGKKETGNIDKEGKEDKESQEETPKEKSQLQNTKKPMT